VGGATGPTAEMRKQVLVVSNAASGTATLQIAVQNGANPVQNESYTAAPSGTSLTVTRTCPAAGPVTITYTATPSSLALIAGTSVDTFTKQ
jgi:hypothetical protein